MPAAKPGEVWIVDLGMVAKVRPCLILTPAPKSDELDIYTVVAHTTSQRGNHWEIAFEKPFFREDGVFDVQRIATVASAKLERKLGSLTSAELRTVLDRLAERLDI